jgi:hypothetical protein
MYFGVCVLVEINAAAAGQVVCEWELILYGWLVWIGNCFIQIDIGPISSGQRVVRRWAVESECPLGRHCDRPQLHSGLWRWHLIWPLRTRARARVKWSTQRQNSPPCITISMRTSRAEFIAALVDGRMIDSGVGANHGRSQSFVWRAVGTINACACSWDGKIAGGGAPVDWVLSVDKVFSNPFSYGFESCSELCRCSLKLYIQDKLSRAGVR